MTSHTKPVILLVAEAVTLAHFARIVTLANALDAIKYQIVIASDPRYVHLAAPLNHTFHPLSSISPAQFAAALSRGKPLYDVTTLIQYVENDIELLEFVKPDLVIGDFRLSLAVSAPLRGVRYAALVNSYWSPYAEIAYPVPDLPMTRLMGVPVAQKLFNLARPMAFLLHGRPLNQVRRHYRLPPLGRDLRTAYSWGDFTLYADVPELVPTRSLPANHYYLGPLLWSARVPLPTWWRQLPPDKPVVLLTLGSSGQADLLPMALDALTDLPLTVIAATAGKIALANLPANAYVTEYLPLQIAIPRASLVICNGGSLTTYQALVSGVPILGICSNMDQLLNMNAIERLGTGLTLRATRLRPDRLKAAVVTLLDRPGYRHAARRTGERFSQFDSGQRFRDFVGDVVG